MNVQINGLVSRIVGIVAILIVCFMISPIYTANASIQTAITSATNHASFLILPTLLPFGPILILLGLFFMGGLLAWKGQSLQSGMGYMIGTIVSIIGTIMILSIFPSILTSFDGTLTVLLAASDTIGVLFLGTVLPLLLYLVVAIGPAIMPAVKLYQSGKKGKSGKTASAMAY
jgi:hypothetical protein